MKEQAQVHSHTTASALLAGVEATAAVLAGAACHGNLLASWQGLATDSRQVQPGNLFVALRGERFDAHAFLQEVQLAGATVLIVEQLPPGVQLLPQVAAITVPDSRRALAQLGAAWRAQFTLPLIAVTGSNGKTTVKEMIAAILRAAHGSQMLATTGNLNNEIGVPISALRLRADHKAAVLELGMNHPGEIALLAEVAQPTVALVNNAQREHQEFMSSVRAVAEENGSVLRFLGTDGIAVFPHGDEFSALWQSLAGTRRCLQFGLDPAADVSASYQSTGFGSRLQVRVAGQECSVELAAAGEHNVKNALAAIACCHAAGIKLDTIRAGLESFTPVNGRLQRKSGSSGQLLIDDTYNANPDSVRAAIAVLAACPGTRYLVLGDMGEVGTAGPAFHHEIGACAATSGIEYLLLLGDLSRHALQGWIDAGGKAQNAVHCTELEALLPHLPHSADSSILVKGSRYMRMERVVQHLTGAASTGGH